MARVKPSSRTMSKRSAKIVTAFSCAPIALGVWALLQLTDRADLDRPDGAAS